jgi:hypothetical protein
VDKSTYVILDAADTDRLLQVLYKGARPLRVHTLICGCGAIADLRRSPSAWDHWQIFPSALCPGCRALDQLPGIQETPELARQRFLMLVEQLTKGGGLSPD